MVLPSFTTASGIWIEEELHPLNGGVELLLSILPTGSLEAFSLPFSSTGRIPWELQLVRYLFKLTVM